MSKQKDKITRSLNDDAREVIVEMATVLHNMGRMDESTLKEYGVIDPKAKRLKPVNINH